MPACLVLIPIEGVLVPRRRVVPEMDRLAGVRSDPACDEHEPRKQLTARVRTIAGKKLACLLGQIQQDGRAIEYPNAVIYDHGHLGVRIESAEGRAELFARTGIDWDGL